MEERVAGLLDKFLTRLVALSRRTGSLGFRATPLVSPRRVAHRYPLLRRTAFFVASSATIWTAMAWTANEREYHWWYTRLGRPTDGTYTPPGALLPTVLEYLAWHERAAAVQAACARVFPPSVGDILEGWLRKYGFLTDAGRLLVLVSVVNVGIFIASRVPRLHALVHNHFVHCAMGTRNYTMYTAIFTHLGSLHMLMNTLFLWRCPLGPIAIQDGYDGGLHRSVLPELLAFYLISGAFSFYAPNVLALLRHRALVRALPRTVNAAELPPTTLPELRNTVGASGALFAGLALGCLSLPAHEPLGRVTLVPYLVSFEVNPWQLAATCLAVDAALVRAGLPIGWQHHLAGWAFGAGYYFWGGRLWNWTRAAVGNERVRFAAETDAETGKVRTVVSVTPRAE